MEPIADPKAAPAKRGKYKCQLGNDLPIAGQSTSETAQVDTSVRSVAAISLLGSSNMILLLDDEERTCLS
jgi:hypothetical protein